MGGKTLQLIRLRGEIPNAPERIRFECAIVNTFAIPAVPIGLKSTHLYPTSAATPR
jgi:hypothetical protein